MAAADHEFRSFFRPNIVALDEGGRLPEIELTSILAFYDGPFIVVGDPQQLSPWVEFNPEAKNEVQSFNPFARQLGYSTLERAVDAGAVDNYLTLNHRSYADCQIFRLSSSTEVKWARSSKERISTRSR
jgi:hypothetical protein